MARTNEMFRLEELTKILRMITRDLIEEINVLGTSELEESDDALTSKLLEKYTIVAPKIHPETIEITNRTNSTFHAGADKTLEFDDYASRMREVDGVIIEGHINYSGDYRMLSHPPNIRDGLRLTGNFWTQRDHVHIVYRKVSPVDEVAFSTQLQNDLDFIERTLSISEKEIDEFNRSLRSKIMDLLANRRATLTT